GGDDGDLAPLLLGELRAAALLVDPGRFLALLDHLLQHGGDFFLAGLPTAGPAGLDVLVLQGGLDEPHGGEPRLVAGPHGLLHGFGEACAHDEPLVVMASITTSTLTPAPALLRFRRQWRGRPQAAGPVFHGRT